jgi:hypothetical protein
MLRIDIHHLVCYGSHFESKMAAKIQKSYDLKDHNMAPNSKNDDGYQFARAKSTWKPNFPRIGGFLYFGGHF